MDMIRATATVLVLALSLALGQMPCRIVPGHGCDAACCGDELATSRAAEPQKTCCAHCSPEPEPTSREPGRARACACPEIAGVLVLAAGIDFEPAALPEHFAGAETARYPTSAVEVAPVPRAPPRPQHSLPLLL